MPTDNNMPHPTPQNCPVQTALSPEVTPAGASYRNDESTRVDATTQSAQGAQVTVTVEVTAADIAEGERGDCKYCPVASALRRAMGREVRVARVSWGFASILGYSLPAAITQFIDAFDCDLPVRPFTFTVTIPASELAVQP